MTSGNEPAMESPWPGLEVGDTASATRRVTEEEIDTFARITGDYNPLHVDEAYAASARFGRKIAHGMLVAGHISAVLGRLLPGPGTIYLQQLLQFKAPVFVDDEITTRVTIVAVRPDKPIVTLQTECTNQRGQLVLTGEAIMLHDPART